MFLDEVRIYVKAGDGGDGMVSFRREKYIPFGGPDGGDGGNGADIVLVVSPRLNTLQTFERVRRFIGHNGGRGGSAKKTGATADPLLIDVPPGTVVRDADSGELLADLTEVGQRVVVAQGGRGGRGNFHFRSSTNQAPRIGEKGAPGEERNLALELKLIADIGIVGVPNAGKSTLLSVISAARPKIAPYPFTTLTPNLGVVLIGDSEVVFADIPGLVEGAHAGVGLGHSFLRHIQRTRLLIHLLDGASANPLADFAQINSELALFDPDLANKPQIVVLNKADIPEARAQSSRIERAARKHGHEFMVISAITRDGVSELLYAVLEALKSLPEPERPNEEVPVFRPADEEAFEIVRENAGYRVVGARIERAAAMTYWEYDEAVMRFQRILDAVGVTDALRRAGCGEGDTVLIGDYELEWIDRW
ncbi:MAG: GTPase ObgE [Anaerolineae bacterium]|nr:GTPase ObgE [Anaerolineae bacterium]